MLKKCKRLVFYSLLLLIFILLPTNVQAASKSKKAMKAYATYLSKLEPDTFEVIMAAGVYPNNRDAVRSFFLYDLDKDGVPELFTMQVLNFRYEIFKVFSYKSGKVTPFKFSNGSSVVFTNNHQANGSYHFWICNKNHIHNYFGGGFGWDRRVFKLSGKKLKEYLRYHEDHDLLSGAVRVNEAFKDGKRISVKKFESLTAKCREKGMEYFLNTKENRNTLSKGKIKVSK